MSVSLETSREKVQFQAFPEGAESKSGDYTHTHTYTYKHTHTHTLTQRERVSVAGKNIAKHLELQIPTHGLETYT